MHTLPLELRVDRRRLGRRLRFQGFGRLQDRMWVAPYDQRELLRQLLTDLGIQKYVAVQIGRSNPAIGVSALLQKAWDLERLVDGYREFATDYMPYLQRAERSRLSDREAFVMRTRLVHRFRGFVNDDPDLPEEMLPDTRDAPACDRRVPSRVRRTRASVTAPLRCRLLRLVSIKRHVRNSC